MATVTFEHVTKKYGDVLAVDDLQLAINDGEFMVLVGPSGCGKTTSLRMIAGLEEISGGQLKIGDRVVNDVPPKDRDIAMVFQSYALYPHMTVRDNMAFGLKLRKLPKADIEKRVNEAAGILSLEKLLDRKPKELSGGQRQRVQTRAEIARLHQRMGTTFVYVTHDQVEAMTMGTRIAVMSEGLLQQVGTPQVLYDQPANRFVAGFIGSPSMNFIDVTFDSSGGTPKLNGPGGWTATLPHRFANSVGATSGRKLVAGFRPEHLELDTIEGDTVSLPGRADVVEYLGNEELLHVSAADKDIVAIVGSDHRVKPGDMLTLNLPLSKLHLFDAESGVSLTSEREPVAA